MARASLDFIRENNVKNGELHAVPKGTWHEHLDDYAFLIWALIEMHRPHWKPLILSVRKVRPTDGRQVLG